jgi:hypothetical protein
MNLQTAAGLIGAYAALFGGIYAVVTRPLEARLADVIERLKRIEEKLDNHAERIARLEERRLR